MSEKGAEPKFAFPFQPYNIQEKFMKELYFTIENSNLGIFESPTGTGKSLSIICGALQWLKDYNQKFCKDLEDKIAILKKKESTSATGTVDWLQEEYEKIKKNQELLSLQSKLDKIKKYSKNFEEMKYRVTQERNSQKTSENCFHNYKNKRIPDIEQIENEEHKEGIEDEDLILEEFKDNEEDTEAENDEEHTQEDVTKIYISSRTHSQLSQFIGEIQRTVFKDNIRVVTLASRQQYCVNSEVRKLKIGNLINERCLELQKSKTKSTSIGEEGKVLKKTKTKSCTSCPYYNQNNITRLKERMLVDIMDIEELVESGKKLKACPYYASRAALRDAEVVLVPHAGVVSSGAREGISLKLQDNVLIIDEAHGLIAALENAHSAPIVAKQLNSVKTYLQFYINKYRSRLNSKNLLMLNQINFVVGKLLAIIKENYNSNKKDGGTIFTLENFVIKAEIDHMNLRNLVDFCRGIKLPPKLHGFSIRYNQRVLEEEMQSKSSKKNTFELMLKNVSVKKSDVVEEVKTEVNNENEVPKEGSAGQGLYAILDFLEMLCDRSENGRVLVQSGNDDTGLLKYLLLNPAEHFADVVKQCRSVIVAGGTMEPVSEFQGLLTTEKDTKAVNIVRCEHVVPAENVLAICLSKGPSNISLNFSFENRQSDALLSEVGRILRNICSVVPGGVVCFLPSYAYEQTVYNNLKNSKVLDAISKKKTVFREPKSASEVEQVLSKFAAAVKSKGALILSVVGGKLSEGLNFSDDLGRCVIVVGMPFPNARSLELQEKMSYLNRTSGPNAGNLFYENLCMKAVNQCIGRAVRHANDYASVLLVDERYSRPHIVSALPSFVQKSLLTNCHFGSTMGNIAQFFSKKKKR